MSKFLRPSVLGSAREVRPHSTPGPVPPHLLPSRHLLNALSIVSAGVSISTRTAVFHNAIASHSTPGCKSRKIMAVQCCMCRYMEADGSPGMQMFSMCIFPSNQIPWNLCMGQHLSPSRLGLRPELHREALGAISKLLQTSPPTAEARCAERE